MQCITNSIKSWKKTRKKYQNDFFGRTVPRPTLALVSKISPYTCYGLASNAYLNRKTERHMWHAIDSTPITALEISLNWLHLTYWPFMKPLSLFWNIRSVIYRVRAFLKHLPKNNAAILTISDDVSILRFRYTWYMLRSNPEQSGERDHSNYLA